MISITCTNCHVNLVIDDAFAGGVCRCQHCGTIQTVPSHLKPAGAAPQVAASKTLYQNKTRAHSDANSGLEGLTEAVAGSGISSGRLQGGTATAVRTGALRSATPAVSPAATPPGKRSLLVPLLVGAGALVVVLLVTVVVLLMKNSGTGATPAVKNTTDNPSSVANSDDSDPNPRISGPQFCNIRVTEPSVVYVLDRGSATERLFDPIKAAVYSSIDSLGQNKKFAVILTDNGSEDFAFPATELADAAPQQLDQLRTALSDIVGSGASHFRSALEKAVARKPALIIVVTAKWTIDDEDAAALLQAAQRGIRIDTLAVGETHATGALEDAAKQSGGDFKQMSEAELRRMGS